MLQFKGVLDTIILFAVAQDFWTIFVYWMNPVDLNCFS